MALCARKEYCLFDMEAKLRSWDLTDDQVVQVINELQKQDFINESRYTQAFVRDKLKLNGWGRVKIRMMLRTKKISESIISRELDKINPEEYLEILKKLLLKKDRLLTGQPDLYIRKQKLIRYAWGRGFEPDIAAQTTDEIIG